MESQVKLKYTPVSCIQYFDWKTLEDWKLAVAKQHFVILHIESEEEESKQSFLGTAFLFSLCINLAYKKVLISLKPFIQKYLSNEECTELITILLKAKSALDMLGYFKQKKLQKHLINLSNKLFPAGIPDDIHEAAEQLLKQIPEACISTYNSKAELIVYGDPNNKNYEIEVSCNNSQVGVLLKNEISCNTNMDMYTADLYIPFFITVEKAIDIMALICPYFSPSTTHKVDVYSDIKQIIKKHNEMKPYKAKDLYKELCEKFGGYEKLNLQYPEMIMEIEEELIRQLYS